MSNLLLAAALAAAVAAGPEAPAKPAPPKPPAAETAPAKATEGKTARAASEGKEEKKKEIPKASKETLDDARQALLGPCSPDMASGTLKSVEVLDGKALSALIEKGEVDQPKPHPAALFMKIGYENAGARGTDYRQVSSHFQLTTDQAQALLGEKLCVFGKWKP